jgi:starch phosphorylase
VAELMRLLVDVHGLTWEKAWEITVPSCAYTNHTLLAEALEKWSVGLLGYLLPRHLQIIFEINRRFLREVAVRYPGDGERQARMSLIEEGEDKKVRMAHLAIVGTHSVNGVSELHTKLLCERELTDFHEMYPGRFNPKTNGVTPRRWLLGANRPLADLITESIGGSWAGKLEELSKLDSFAHDAPFLKRFAAIKRSNKELLAKVAEEQTGIRVDPSSIFDVQIKRIHMYKRQTLNVLQIIAHWLQVKQGRVNDFVPRTYFFGGKAAPDYQAAKQTIQLICSVADMINKDPTTNEQLKVVFLPNYSVSLAEKIIPAAEVSEQISTAGYEASGTGNMKFALNGALTVGTLDGANVEIKEEVGDENIFIFGLTAAEVTARRAEGYRPRDIYESNRLLREVVDLVQSGFFSPEQPELFHGLMGDLLDNDYYLNFVDFDAYMAAQAKVAKAYGDTKRWNAMAVRNVAHSGKFSSDRTIAEYNRDIWKAKPIKVEL